MLWFTGLVFILMVGIAFLGWIGFQAYLSSRSALGYAAKVDLKEYKKEPPQGRYADYRKLEDYLNWMKTHGYKFNAKMHVVKK